MKVDIGDGVRLWFDVDGAGLVPDGSSMRERPTLLLLHGGPGMDHSIYKESALHALTDVAQVVFYDHRGQGRSDWRTADEWNLDVWADDVVRLCEALGVAHPIVFGASFGGFVAQRYLARHPDHASKVILACTSPTLDVDTIVAAFERVGGPEAGAVAKRFWEGDHGALADYMTTCMPLYTAQQADPSEEWTGPSIAARAVMNMDVLFHFQNGEQHTMELAAGLANAACSVLVLGGELDPICPIETNAAVAAALPPDLVTFRRFPGLSHMDVGEAPEALAAIREFISAS